MSTVDQHHYASPAELDPALADFVAARLAAAIAERGTASLVVSGGNTPRGFFACLAQRAVDWSRVAITLADDRWVAPEHVHSNERSVRQHLLQGAAAAARFIPLYAATATAAQGVAATAQALAAMARPFDVVILGMGGDGHTASLFPGAWPAAEASPDGGPAADPADPTPPCLAVPAPAPPNVPVERISLSAAALCDCRQLIVHITGQAKLDVLRRALEPGSPGELPIRLAWRQQRAPCAVFWAPA